MEADLFAQGEGWSKLSAANYNRLVNIASTYNGVATIKARNILKMYFSIQFGTMPIKPGYDPLQFTSTIRSTDDNEMVKIYPNPAFNTLNIEVSKTMIESVFRLININGKVVKEVSLTTINNRIDVSGLENSIYFYEITQDGKVLSADKVIILD